MNYRRYRLRKRRADWWRRISDQKKVNITLVLLLVAIIALATLGTIQQP